MELKENFFKGFSSLEEKFKIDESSADFEIEGEKLTFEYNGILVNKLLKYFKRNNIPAYEKGTTNYSDKGKKERSTEFL